MTAKQVYAILNNRISLGGGTTADIQEAVNNYLENHPVMPGATEEQAEQIEKNKDDIAKIQKDLEDYISSGGDGTGTNDYLELINKPSINHVTLESNKSFEELGMVPLSNLEIMEIIKNAANTMTN